MAHTRQHGHRPWISDGSPSGTLPVGTQRWNLCGPDGFLPLEPGWIAECPNDDGQARVFAVMPQSQSIEIGTLALDPVVGGQRLEGARLGDHHAVIGRPFQPVRRFDLTSGGAIALTDETCGAAGDAQPIFGAIDGGILFSGCRGGVAGLFLDDGTTILELAPGLWQAGTKFGDVVVLTRAVAGTVETLVTDGSTVGTELLPVSLGLAPDTSDAGARTKTCAIHDGAAGEAEVWAFDSITRAVRWVGIASPSARLVEGPRLTWILGDWTEPDGYRSVSVCDAEAATLTTVDTAALPGRVIGATLGTLWLLDPWAEVGGPELLRIDAATGAQHVVHRARDVVGGSGPTHGLVVDDKVYVTLADPDHGRELWVVDAVGPLIFADDFESGDTSRWDP